MVFHGRESKPRAGAGFTLIEMIGVMAVIAILASAIAPSVVDLAVKAKAEKETISLNSLAESLRQSVLQTKSIPLAATSSWVNAIALENNLPSSKIEFNHASFRRGYYIDPHFLTSPASSFSGYPSQGLTTAPISPRIMLVSNLSAHVPSAPTTAAEFSAIWDQTASTSLVESQSIKVVRLNLRSTFHRIIFNNDSVEQASYAFEGNSKQALAAGVTERYVLDSTKVRLYTHSYPNGALDFVSLVNSDESFRYDGSAWSQP